MDIEKAVWAVRGRLGALADPARAAQEKRYLKSALEHLGASVPAIRKAARGFLRANPDLDRPELLGLAAGLWALPVHECRMCASELLEARSELLEPADLEFLERLVRESKTWALVDNLAANTVGRLVERHPALVGALDAWAADDDFWVRRAALLALLRPLRRGEGDFERFGRYADAMLEEREFFVRKAIGWVLREAGKRRPELVTEWLVPRARRASGLTVREAVRHLPAEQRARVLAAR